MRSRHYPRFIADVPIYSRPYGGDITPCPNQTRARNCSSVKPCDRVYPGYPLMPDIIEVIRDKNKPVINEYSPVEIMQDKEPGEPESGAPERRRYPSVE